MKTLFLISYHYPPAGGPSAPASLRMGKFAKYLPTLGWQPIVFSAPPDYYSLQDESLIFAPDSILETISNPMPGFRGKARLTALLPAPGLDVFWSIKTARKAITLIKKYNPAIIFASSPPVSTLLAGYYLHRYTNLPLVLDYRDQWTQSPYRTGPELYKRWDYWLESKILKTASLAIVSNDGRLNEHSSFWKDYGPEVITVPNGFDAADFEGLLPDRVPMQDYPNELVIRYLGQLYGARLATVSDFLRALNAFLLKYADTPRLRMQFWGKQLPSFNPVPNSSTKLIVEFYPAVKYKQSLALQLGADVLILIVGKHAQSNIEITSKIFEYIHSKRPVIVAGASEILRNLFKNSDQVFLTDDEPNSEVMERLLNWMIKFKELKNYQSLSNNYDGQVYSRQDSSKLLAKAFEKIISIDKS